MVPDHVGKIFNRDPVILPVLVEDAAGAVGVLAGGLGIGGGDVVALEQGLLAALFPADARGLLEGLAVLIELVAAIEIALELGDVALLAVVTAGFVENLHEDRQQRVDLGLADDIGFLVDVEQDALRRHPGRLLEGAAQHLVVVALFQERLERGETVEFAVFQHQGEHFQQVRLARAEKPRQPDAVGALIVVVGVQELL